MNKLAILIILLLGYRNNCNAKVPCASGGTFNYPFKCLADAFVSIGFNPAIKGNSYFVVTADVHYGSKGTDGMIKTINEVNTLNPIPAFFCVDGDMICNGSPSFGVLPTIEGREMAINEFRAFKKDLDRLSPSVRAILALGNHDTHPKEVDPLMFREVFPGYPPYQSFNLTGVHVIVLNGHNTGYIDAKQMEWVAKDVKAISKSQEVIILIHQPSMSHRVRERGIPKAVSEIFRNHRGPIWLIGGHEHLNSEKVFQLKKTKLIEHTITTGTANMWGGQERPGYWIYCLSKGKVAGRIYRQKDQGYRTETYPDLTLFQNVPRPFDHLGNIVWKIFVGDGDLEFLINCKANDCLEYWSYVKELTYRLPLKETGNRCTKIAMLCEYITIEKLNLGGQYFISSDLNVWKEIKVKDAKFETLNFVIPQNFRQAENLYFKFIPAGEVHVGGFALLK